MFGWRVMGILSSMNDFDFFQWKNECICVYTQKFNFTLLRILCSYYIENRITSKMSLSIYCVIFEISCDVTSHDISNVKNAVTYRQNAVSWRHFFKILFQSFCYWFLLFWWIFSVVCLLCSPRKSLSLLFSHFYLLSYNSSVHKFVWKSFQSL